MSDLLATRASRIAAWFMVAVTVLAVVGPWLSPHDMNHIDTAQRLRAPSLTHWLGTDEFGRDVATRVLFGGRTSLLVGGLVMVVSVVVGTFLGVTSAYYRRLDGPIMRVLDGINAFPTILLAIAVMASLGPSTTNVVATLSIVTVPSVARLVRGSALVIKALPYVESAVALGVRRRRLFTRYIAANAASPLIVAATFGVAGAILAEASLSYLGAGIPPDVPTWGNLLREGQKHLRDAWWLAAGPGVILTGVVLALNLVADALRDALDPRSDRL